MQDTRMQEYANFMVKTAVNIQAGQTLIINSPLEAAEFARLCAQAAYEAGARDVCVNYNDEQLSRLRMKEAAVDVLEDVKPWKLRSYLDYAEGEGGVCVLSIYARDPELYKGLDTEKIDKATIALEKALKPWRDLIMAGRIQWSIASIPTPSWAAKVFPNKTVQEAQQELWKAIYSVCRIGLEEGVQAAWDNHAKNAAARIERLHALGLDALHLKSKNGTDLRVGLAQGHIFAGIREESVDGVPFFANVPSEEVFTAPHCEKVEGVVYSSLPYVYNGNVIEGIRVRFEQGRVVEHSAEKGEELLGQLLQADEGAARLGEVALVPASSPVRSTGLLFYNTLFDENAACHIAFGAGYPSTMKEAETVSREELRKRGLNESLIHEDVMVGTEDMNVIGISKDGKETMIMENGEWCF